MGNIPVVLTLYQFHQIRLGKSCSFNRFVERRRPGKGITEAQAIKEGRIVRDTVKQGVLETIFNKDYPIDDLRYVPFTKRKYQFNMGASSMFTDSGVEVPLFQAWISNTYIFEDIEDQYKDEILQENGERKRLKKYPGLKVGDLKEANNNVGNWE